IKPIILFNKIDLLTKNERQVLEEELDVYKKTGYPVIYASTKERDGLEMLLTQLQQKTSVFAGQSGVGKSSLVNSLIAEAEIEVGEISESNGLGKHTTSASRLYHLASGGNIIDSPGVRDFRLWNITREQLADGFIEFRPFLGKCRFRNCQHMHEPGCALLAAEAEGLINNQRLKSFYRISKDLSQ
ncbi:MAG: ribosome small subunit-dependent GTPase A, partial [Gammaproteobacteria bacterium]|nr:ribosome small subunit-dependent GTPase A [Gammaproteobacteria bacterium]